MTDRRNLIWDALHAMVSAAQWASITGTGTTSFAHKSTRLQIWDQCPAQPAIYTTQGAERVTRVTGRPQIATMNFRLITYQNVGLDTTIARPGVENDRMLQAIMDLMDATRGPDGRQTLGGLVHDARIEGEIMKDSGDDDGQGMMLIPVVVILP